MTPSVDNIIASYLRASDAIVADGMSWYNRAHEFAATLDSDVSRAAAVIAVLSPNTSWTANMTLASAAYAGRRNLGFPDKVRKVARLLDEGHGALDVIGGPKVTSFFLNILDPEVSHPAVIDRHAFDIAIGRRTDDKSRGSLSRKGVYNDFANCYAEAAFLAGITTAQIQAITWVEWRNHNGIRI